MHYHRYVRIIKNFTDNLGRFIPDSYGLLGVIFLWNHWIKTFLFFINLLFVDYDNFLIYNPKAECALNWVVFLNFMIWKK